jgi:hypothetical protein
MRYQPAFNRTFITKFVTLRDLLELNLKLFIIPFILKFYIVPMVKPTERKNNLQHKSDLNFIG